MNKVNFHVHSTGSDGQLSPEEVVKEAIKAGITHLCFTEHTGIRKEVREFEKSGITDEYAAEIFKLKEKYRGKIEVLFGAEFDWADEFKEWTAKEIKARKYDYIVGSVHFIKYKREYLRLGWNDMFWQEILKKESGEDFVKEYFKQVRLMAESMMYDSIAHFDVVKAVNVDNRYFNQDSDWYKKEVMDTLKDIKKAGIAIEINASGWRYPIGEQFPSTWILREAFRMGIPITIGNDFHGNINFYNNSAGIDMDLQRAYELARGIGWKKVLVFKNRKREEVEI